MSDPKKDLDAVEHISLWLHERRNDSDPIPLGRVSDRQDWPAQPRQRGETVVHLRPLEARDPRAPRQPDMFAEAIAKALQEELEPQFVEAPSILQRRRRFGNAARFAAAAGVAALAALVVVTTFPASQGPAEEETSSVLPVWQSLKSSLFPAPRRKPAPTLVVRESSGPVNEPLLLGIDVNSPADSATVTISRMPAGARLTAGKRIDTGEWRVPVQEISGASIIPPTDFIGVMNLTAELRGSNGVAPVKGFVRLTWTSATPGDPVGAPASAATTPAVPTLQQLTAAAPPPQLQQPIASQAPPETARVEPPVREISAREVAGFVRRAQQLLATGDLQAARLLLLRAAEAHDARAALALAKTYDPTLSKQLGGADPEADLAQARSWYQKAEQWGAPEAKRQLEALASFTR